MRLRSAIVYAPVPMGYGSPHFLFIYHELAKANFRTLIFEPIDNRLPYYQLEGISRKNFQGNLVGALSYGLSIVLSVIKQRKRIVLVMGSDFRFPLPWLFSLIALRIRYYYEIDDNFDYSTGSYPDGKPVVVNTRNPQGHNGGSLSLLKRMIRKTLFGPIRYKALIAPESNRLRIAKDQYPEANHSWLVLNASPAIAEPAVARRLPSEDRPIVLYQGQIHRIYSCANILFETIEALSDRFKFVIAGPCEDDQDRERLESLAASGKVEYLGLLPHKQLESLRDKAHVSLVLWDNIRLTTRYAAPNKLFESISAGLPIVCTPNESLVEWNEKYGFGEVMHDFSSLALQEALIRITEDPDRYSEVSAANIASSQRELNFDRQIKPVMDWLKSFD